MWELSQKYSWADEDDDLAWTVAAIGGRAPDEVVRVYGGDPSEPVGELPFGEAWAPVDSPGDYSYLQVIPASGHVVAIEPNGWIGKSPGIAQLASSNGGSFFSAYWNVEGRWYITESTNGRLTAAFDVVQRYPSDLLPGWAAGVDFATDAPGALCLALMEQQTGVAFEREWLTRALPTYRVRHKPTG